MFKFVVLAAICVCAFAGVVRPRWDCATHFKMVNTSVPDLPYATRTTDVKMLYNEEECQFLYIENGYTELDRAYWYDEPPLNRTFYQFVTTINTQIRCKGTFGVWETKKGGNYLCHGHVDKEEFPMKRYSAFTYATESSATCPDYTKTCKKYSSEDGLKSIILDSRGRLVKWNGQVVFTWYDDIPGPKDFPTQIQKCVTGIINVDPDFFDYFDDSCSNGPKPSSPSSDSGSDSDSHADSDSDSDSVEHISTSDASSIHFAAVLLLAALIAALF